MLKTKLQEKDVENALEQVEEDIFLEQQKDNVRSSLIFLLEKNTDKIQDESVKEDIGNLARDHEAYSTSYEQEKIWLQTNKYFVQYTSVNLPRTTYGVSLIQKSVKSIGDSAKRLIFGGKADKSKTLYKAASERNKNNQSTAAKVVSNPIGTLSSPISFVSTLLTEGTQKRGKDGKK